MTSSEVQALRQQIAELTKALAKNNETLLNYIEADDAWKVRAEPVVKAFENSSWLFRLFVAFLKVVGLLGAAGAVVYSASRFIRNL